MKKTLILFFVFLAIFIASGALYDTGAHHALAMTLMIASGAFASVTLVLSALLFIQLDKPPASPDCLSCGMPGRKQPGPTWTKCVACGKSRGETP